MANITIVGGAGAIGLVHAWVLAASGHDVTILDTYADGQPGRSFQQLQRANDFCFRFAEVDELEKTLPDAGETVQVFKDRLKAFPPAFKSRVEEVSPSNPDQLLSKEGILQIIENATRLPGDRIHLAQKSSDITKSQDAIIVAVKGAALNKELGEKITRIPQKQDTPVVIFANGIQPWITPQPNFGGKRLDSINNIYDCVEAIGADKVKAGVLIKYGAMIEGDGKVRVRSKFLNTKNVISNATNTDLTDDLKVLSTIYTAAGISTQPTQDIRHTIIDKLSYNLTGSMRGAIFGNTFGELADNTNTNKAVRDCAIEFYQLAERLGVKLAESQSTFVESTIRALQANKDVIGSPLQDILSGRRTEKDQIIKAVIELAEQYHLQAPVLKAMYSLISTVEEKAVIDVPKARILQGSLLEKLAAERGEITRLTQSVRCFKP